MANNGRGDAVRSGRDAAEGDAPARCAGEKYDFPVCIEYVGPDGPAVELKRCFDYCKAVLNSEMGRPIDAVRSQMNRILSVVVGLFAAVRLRRPARHSASRSRTASWRLSTASCSRFRRDASAPRMSELRLEGGFTIVERPGPSGGTCGHPSCVDAAARRGAPVPARRPIANAIGILLFTSGSIAIVGRRTSSGSTARPPTAVSTSST